jgi:putative ABC transport system permease protein
MRRLRIELRESFGMALGAIASHKLRSGLTLLGVLVGVFSIILVMTAMRAMKNNIEQNLGQLGATTFSIRKTPQAFFGSPQEFMKFFARKEITYAQAKRFQQRARFVPHVALHATFWRGELTSRHARTPPNVSVEGGTAALFQTNNWSITAGRTFLDSDIAAARYVCLLSNSLAETLFPLGSPVGQRVKIAALNYAVIGVFERSASAEDSQSLASHSDHHRTEPLRPRNRASVFSLKLLTPLTCQMPWSKGAGFSGPSAKCPRVRRKTSRSLRATR